LAGYHGRVGLYELMVVDADIFEKLRVRQSSCREIRQLSIHNGMRSMWEDGLEKMEQGITSLNEIMRTIGIINA